MRGERWLARLHFAVLCGKAVFTTTAKILARPLAGNVMTKFMINNKPDAFKTDVNLLN